MAKVIATIKRKRFDLSIQNAFFDECFLALTTFIAVPVQPAAVPEEQLHIADVVLPTLLHN